jgi:hypothetical protein
MALKIQLRRDLAANWAANNPLLLNGEIGIETDTLKFKIGNGTQRWNAIESYAFKPGQPNGIATLNSEGKVPFSQLPDQVSLDDEAAAAIQNALSGITTTNIPEGGRLYFTNTRAMNAVEGMFDPIGSAAQALSSANAHTAAKFEDAISEAALDATQKADNAVILAGNNAEQFTNTAINLLTTSDIEEGSRLYFTDIRAINALGPAMADTKAYLDQKVLEAETYVDAAISNFDPTAAITSTSDLPEGSNLYFTNARAISATNAARTNVLVSALTAVDDLRAEITNTLSGYIPLSDINISGGVSGLDSSGKIQESSIPSSIARLSGPSFTGDTHVENISVSGNLVVNGTTTTVSTQDLVVSDPLIYIGEGNSSNLVDLGLVSSFDDGTYQHSGIVRDSSDGKWKIFKGVIDEPTTTVNFSQGSLDNLQVGGFESSSAIIGSVTNEEIQRLSGVTSNIQSQFDNIVSIYATSESLTQGISSANTYTDNAINGISNSLEAYALASDRNVAGGYAGLDIEGKILTSAIPSSISLAIENAANAANANINGTYTNGNSSSSINKITYGTDIVPPSSGNSAGDIYIQY